MDKEKVEVITDNEPEEPKYEMIEYEGEPARFYPASGAVMVFSERYNRWIIRANFGGRPDFDPQEMALARKLRREEAIIEGLEAAGYALDLRSATAVLSAIVASRAKNAIEDEGRTGNADAKFVFSLVAKTVESEEEQPALRIDMDRDTAERLVQRLIDL